MLAERAVDLDRLEVIAGRLARALRTGDVVLLFGPLGAGKTTMVRMLCRLLGVTDPVRSPSFTIANVYAGQVTINHLDLYRLETIAVEDSLALEEYVSPGAITMVEWPEAGLVDLGEADWVVRLQHENPATRFVEVRALGEESLGHWSETA